MCSSESFKQNIQNLKQGMATFHVLDDALQCLFENGLYVCASSNCNKCKRLKMMGK